MIFPSFTGLENFEAFLALKGFVVGNWFVREIFFVISRRNFKAHVL